MAHPITLTMLQQTYHRFWFGNQHPTRIVVSEARFKEITRLVFPEDEVTRMKVRQIRFMDADLVRKEDFDDFEISFINEKRPGDLRYSDRLVMFKDAWLPEVRLQGE